MASIHLSALTASPQAWPLAGPGAYYNSWSTLGGSLIHRFWLAAIILIAKDSKKCSFSVSGYGAGLSGRRLGLDEQIRPGTPLSGT